MNAWRLLHERRFDARTFDAVGAFWQQREMHQKKTRSRAQGDELFGSTRRELLMRPGSSSGGTSSTCVRESSRPARDLRPSRCDLRRRFVSGPAYLAAASTARLKSSVAVRDVEAQPARDAAERRAALRDRSGWSISSAIITIESHLQLGVADLAVRQSACAEAPRAERLLVVRDRGRSRPSR